MMRYLIGFVAGMAGGFVTVRILEIAAQRREWKRGEKMRAANLKAFQEMTDLPLSALEYARRSGKVTLKVGPKGAAGDSGAAKR